MYPIVARVRSSLLPHISRIFTANPWFHVGKYILYIVCTLYIGISILVAIRFPQPYLSYRTHILSSPLLSFAYFQFGDALHLQGKFSQAQEQLAFVSDITSSSKVLGVQSGWFEETDNQEKEYTYWKAMTEKRPEYKDAYIQLAVSSYKTKRMDEAKSALTDALRLDPNNLEIPELLQKMQ